MFAKYGRARSSENGKRLKLQYGHSTCAYSNPAFGQMFKMNAKTDADGMVSCVFATIYDSLDLMYGDLCLDLKLHSKSVTLKYRRNKEDLLMDFI